MGGSSTVGPQDYNLSVYGTQGVPAATNAPGTRYYSQSWTGSGSNGGRCQNDNNGNLWLYGGEGYDANGQLGLLSDLWEFNPSLGKNGEWTWISGSTLNGQAAVYGTLGVPAATNNPGARGYGMTWTDNNGNFWLFGGDGAPNALWKFDPSKGQAGEWTWMGGNDTAPSTTTNGWPDNPGVYGTLGTPAATNMPGWREEAVTWTDNNGNLWLFGGEGLDASGNQGFLNDLWVFVPSLGQYGEWIWIGGSNTIGSNEGQPGVYGTLGTAAAANIPGARLDAVSWVDGNGNLWLFSGFGVDATGNLGELNDLWEFDISRGHYGEWTWMGGSSTVGANGGQSGVYGTQGKPAATNIPGGRLETVGWTDQNGNLWLFGGYGFDATGNSGELADLWEFNPSLGQFGEWAWVDGSSSVASDAPVYGTLGVPAATNIPGGRSSDVSWTDSNGNFWLFGGLGISANSGEQILNDLWEYRFTSESGGQGGQQGGGQQGGGGYQHGGGGYQQGGGGYQQGGGGDCDHR
jgi:N-acetylneuraminic acid mutarotase